MAAADVVLDHWAGRRRLRSVPVVDGLPRRCASQEGNALAVACRLGLADDDRARTLAHRLADWQWPDGGWNCDRRPAARRSSFHETLPALWGLHEHAAATGDSTSAAAAARAAELLLAHRVVLSLRTGRPLSAAVVQLHYPPYWYYDALQALLVLTRAGFGADPRTEVARDLVASRRGESGRWSADRRWWKRPGSAGSGVEAVDWREQGDVESQLLTLNALRVLAPRAGTSSP
ncbi:MAG: hypothetical protein ACJ74O_08240 [Frankiaceae bacterium]